MTENGLKRITLLILEIFLLQGNRNISETFAYLYNGFIYRCFEENKELLSVIHDLEILKYFIEANYEVLSADQMLILIERYHGFDGYLQLLEEIGPEVDAKLNELAILFLKYRQEYIDLRYANPKEYYPKGFPRILQQK